ncbi:MAG TPA: acylphosphatase [Candidatus Acetothermia bacterium]|nr:acylphosphatase [Candidatus Acetothermia bacterium]HEX32145.1 acylphosphatase [Candidatus Acetothermia bacterium]
MQETLDNLTIRAHILVSGRVQGVFYRASARAKAVELGLRGWVRNLPDGRVEMVAQGEADDVQAFIAWAHSGPPMAIVDSVEVTWDEPNAGEAGFRIR